MNKSYPYSDFKNENYTSPPDEGNKLIRNSHDFLLWIVLLVCLFLTLFMTTKPALAMTEGAHCIGSGPLPLADPDFCGCTWGAVYYRGMPVSGARVSLSYGGQQITTISQQTTVEAYPFYSLTGLKLGASKGDIMTLTVAYAGQQITRTLKAWPEGTGEQQVALALPAQGTWRTWHVDSYTHTVAAVGDQLWLGGTRGLLALNLTQQTSTTLSLPWSEPAVVALAFAANGTGWAAGPHHLAHFDGTNWQNETPPFAATLRTLALQGDTLWVGGGDSSGALAQYDGGWQTTNRIKKPITTLSVEDGFWLGSWGDGVEWYHGDGADLEQGWTQYRVAGGLASDYVLSSIAGDGMLWFGTQPYLISAGVAGGISRYNLGTDTWQTYTTTHGLPVNSDPQLPNAPAPIMALTLDDRQQLWAGSQTGVYRLATATQWVKEQTSPSALRRLAAYGSGVVAIENDGSLLQFDPNQQVAAPTPVQFINPPTRVAQNQILTLQASIQSSIQAGLDNARILAWDWRSDREGPLCTTASTCTLPASQLAPGRHTIRVAVQDENGQWSAATTTQITIEQTRQLYLPVVYK